MYKWYLIIVFVQYNILSFIIRFTIDLIYNTLKQMHRFEIDAQSYNVYIFIIPTIEFSYSIKF